MPVSWQCALLCSLHSACRAHPSPIPVTSKLDQVMLSGHPKKFGSVQALSRQPRESCRKAPHHLRQAPLPIACKH